MSPNKASSAAAACSEKMDASGSMAADAARAPADADLASALAELALLMPLSGLASATDPPSVPAPRARFFAAEPASIVSRSFGRHADVE